MRLHSDEDYLGSCIDACISAGNRTRQAAVVVMTCCILLCSVILNTNPNNWVKQRGIAYARLYKKGVLDHAHKDSTGKLVLPDLIDTSNFKPGDMALLGPLTLRIELEKLMEYNTRSLVEFKQVTVPIIGTKFDCNDTGLFASVGLIGLALLFRRSASAEHVACDVTFAVAKRFRKLKPTYRVLAAHQVLSFPPIITDDNTHAETIKVFESPDPKFLIAIKKWLHPHAKAPSKHEVKALEADGARENQISENPYRILDRIGFEFTLIAAWAPFTTLFFMVAFDMGTSGIGDALSHWYTAVILTVEVLSVLSLWRFAHKTTRTIQSMRILWRTYCTEACEEPRLSKASSNVRNGTLKQGKPARKRQPVSHRRKTETPADRIEFS